jgi:hypothetical protein
MKPLDYGKTANGLGSYCYCFRPICLCTSNITSEARCFSLLAYFRSWGAATSPSHRDNEVEFLRSGARPDKMEPVSSAGCRREGAPQVRHNAGRSGSARKEKRQSKVRFHAGIDQSICRYRGGRSRADRLIPRTCPGRADGTHRSIRIFLVAVAVFGRTKERPLPGRGCRRRRSPT